MLTSARRRRDCRTFESVEAGPSEQNTFEGADGRRVVLFFAVLTLLAASFFATSVIDAYVGGADNMAATTHDATARSIDTETFASRLASSGAFVVHVGTGGRRIPGTVPSCAGSAARSAG